MPRATSVTVAAARDDAGADARGWANVLGGVPLFAELNRRHLGKVAALGRIRRFHQGTAIVRAGEEEPHLIIDTATLTGAQMVALGARTSGVMGNIDAVREAVVTAADAAGDAMWPMPLPDDLRTNLESSVADLANLATQDRYGGMLAAGLFLREFVPEQTPWAHLDIAGPAYNEGKAYGYTPHGGTGAAVRTLVEVADRLARGTFALR